MECTNAGLSSDVLFKESLNSQTIIQKRFKKSVLILYENMLIQHIHPSL